MTSLEREHFVAANMFPVKSLSDSKKLIIGMSDRLSESSVSVSDNEQAAEACGSDFLVKLDSIQDIKTFAKIVSEDIFIKVDKINGDILGLVILNKEISSDDLKDLDEVFGESRRLNDR